MMTDGLNGERDLRESAGVLHIDAKPTDQEDYNWMHLNCETIASSVVMFENPDGRKIIGIFRMYRDFLEENLETVDFDIEAERFVAWLRDAAGGRGEMPEQWTGEMFGALDDMLVEAVSEKQHSPDQAFELFDRYVEQATEDFEEANDLEGFFDDY